MGSLGVLALPGRARALVLGTFACAGVVLLWSIASLELERRPVTDAVALLVAAVGTAALSGSLRHGRNSSPRFLTTDSCWTVAAALLLPLPFAAPFALVVRLLVTSLLTGAQWTFKLVFNLCVASLAAAAAGAVAAVALPVPLSELSGEHALGTVAALVAAGGAHFAVDQLVVVVVWLTEPTRTWRDVRTSPAVDDVEAALVLLGALLAPLLAVSPAFVLLAVPLPLVLHRLTGAGLLWQAADRDAKTGLLNPVAWTSAATRTLGRATASGREVAVVVVDLDHFKQVNDRYGHLAGDAVLVRTAEVLRDGLRPDSLLARFGGEEFVVLLPDVDVDVARATAERLRRAVAAHAGAVGAHDLTVTASFGVACGSGLELVDLLAAADTALYVAKQAGRDRVEVAVADVV